MKIYIPKHLRSIKIIEQLYRMMQSYSEQAVDETDSFSEFQVIQSTIKFLENPPLRYKIYSSLLIFPLFLY